MKSTVRGLLASKDGNNPQTFYETMANKPPRRAREYLTEL
jgi:hypothetical protein